MSDDDIILVSEGVRVFGAYRDQLFNAMRRLGWLQSASRWFAPHETEPDLAFDQLLREVRPVEGMRPEDLEDAMEGQAPEMNDVWREAIGPYAALRAVSDLAPGMWLYHPPAPLDLSREVQIPKPRTGW